MARTTAEPDSVPDPDGEGQTPPPMGRDSGPPSEQQSAPMSSGSDRPRVDPRRAHDIAKILVVIWALFSSLSTGFSTGMIPYTDNAVGGLLWVMLSPDCAIVAMFAPWAIVFLVWKWPAIGAFALLAAFLLWTGFSCMIGGWTPWAMPQYCAGSLALPAEVALMIHLQGGKPVRLAGDPQPHTDDD
jgi:hypothetical protein